MYAVILAILVLLLIAVLPTWQYSSRWSYYPSGAVGFLLLLVLIWVLFVYW